MVSIKDTHAEGLALNSNNDFGKMNPNTRKMETSIRQPSGKASDNDATADVVQKELEKNGQGLMTGYKEIEKAELTKLLEVIPARKPEQAKIGEVIRFMHHPSNDNSAYWMEGELEEKIDKYTVE